MKVTAFTIGQPGRSDHPFLAKFDLQLNADIELFGLMLRERDDGRRYIASPRFGSGNFASMSPEFRDRIMALVEPIFLQVTTTPAASVVVAAG